MNDNLLQAEKAFDKLYAQEVNLLIAKLLKEEKVLIPQLIAAYAEELRQFKHDAQHDIQVLSECGLELGQKEIKNLPKLKVKKGSGNVGLYNAMAHTLLTIGYRDTEFGKKMASYVDTSKYDEKWYKDHWQLRTVDPDQQGWRFYEVDDE